MTPLRCVLRHHPNVAHSFAYSCNLSAWSHTIGTAVESQLLSEAWGNVSLVACVCQEIKQNCGPGRRFSQAVFSLFAGA